MADFSKDQGDIQNVAPNTRQPRKSGTPKTGFDSAPKSHRAETGPGPGVPPNTKRIR